MARARTAQNKIIARGPGGSRQGRKRRILREAWRVIVWRGHAQHKTI
jgi:hypothetical protein